MIKILNILEANLKRIKDNIDKNLEPCYSYDTFNNNKEELFKLLSDLIKINSENFRCRGNEKECGRGDK